MYDQILLPTDGSDDAEEAIEHGLELAKQFDAKVHALYVVPTEATYVLTAEHQEQQMEEHRSYGEQVVTDLAERAADMGLDATGVIETGKISEEIVQYAEENDIDTIVIGRRGRGSFEKYLGSIAERVVRGSSVPVTVVGEGII